MEWNFLDADAESDTMAESDAVTGLPNVTNGTGADVCTDFGRMQINWIVCNLVPAIVLLVLATFFRFQTKPFKWVRRPKLAYPVNLLDGYSHRLAYLFAFLVNSHMVFTLLFGFGGEEEFDKLSPPVRFLMWASIKYLSIMVVGLVFYPLLLCITYSNIFTDVAGFFYTCDWWSMYVCLIIKCNFEWINGIMYIPVISACILLAGYFVRRLFKRCHERYRRRKREDFQRFVGQDDDFQRTHYYRRVRYLLTPQHSGHRNGWRVIRWMKRIYPVFPGFKYSTRSVCTFGLSLVVLYQMSILYITEVLAVVEGWVSQIANPSPYSMQFIETLRTSFNVATYPAILIAIINCVLSLRSYRENTRKLWKGDRSSFPAKPMSSHSIVISSLRYSSYSIAYLCWGFLVLQASMWVIIWLCLVIVRYNLLKPLVEEYWMYVFGIMAFLIAQQLLARCILLKRNSNGSLVIDNRHLFHIVMHFFFFINVIIGFVGSMIRILKAMVIGILIAGRVDQCLTPRGFEWFDRGFRSYRAFLELEVSLTHPVVVVFCHLLNEPRKRKMDEDDPDTSRRNSDADVEIKEVMVAEPYDVRCSGWRSSRKARNRWFVALTLMRNKRLVYDRLRQTEEREARERHHQQQLCDAQTTCALQDVLVI